MIFGIIYIMKRKWFWPNCNASNIEIYNIPFCTIKNIKNISCNGVRFLTMFLYSSCTIFGVVENIVWLRLYCPCVIVARLAICYVRMYIAFSIWFSFASQRDGKRMNKAKNPESLSYRFQNTYSEGGDLQVSTYIYVNENNIYVDEKSTVVFSNYVLYKFWIILLKKLII